MEALKCKEIGAYKASCSMLRRSLQGALIQLNAKGKNLFDQINSIEDLPESVKEWSHQIRIFGNWGAHPDKDGLKDVGKQEAEEAINFLQNFYTYVFIMPKKVERAKSKTQNKE